MNKILQPLSAKALIAFIHDLIMAGLAFNIALYLRLGDYYFQQGDFIIWGTGVSVGVSAVIFYLMGLYRGVWRYASMRDLVAITKSASLAIMITALGLFLITRLEDYPRSVPIINWFIVMALLGGPRFLYRLNKDRKLDLAHLISTEKQIPCLLIGAGDGAELFLRALSREFSSPYIPVGIVAENRNRQGLDIHGVSVLGSIEDLPAILEKLKKTDNAPQRLILTKDDWAGEKVRELLDLSEALGVPLSRLPKLTDLQTGAVDKINVRPIEVEDLLGRPQKSLDKSLPQKLLTGKRVLVTGAGGSIGSELVRQIASYGPSELMMLEASEFALYTIDMEIARTFEGLKVHPMICNIRDKGRLDQVFHDFKPEIVFHAAALKHVPLVESNPLEGVLTNAIGTRNVADSCLKHHVKAMVQISTDKAVNPTNIMGATKRIAESYAQALDLESQQQGTCRFITVRFGNVLGSTGSVVPLFQKQLNAGGPLTVTHRDMIRYFMTVREAVELVLQAAVLAQKESEMEGKICVLDMGEPVRILHLAEQMIRLAGLEPYKDVDIKITGLRPGEKLFEEIFHGDEPPTPSAIEAILIATPRTRKLPELIVDLNTLEQACNQAKVQDVFSIIRKLVPETSHKLIT